MLLPVGQCIGRDGNQWFVEDGRYTHGPHQVVLHLRDNLEADLHIHNCGDDGLNVLPAAILQGDDQFGYLMLPDNLQKVVKSA